MNHDVVADTSDGYISVRTDKTSILFESVGNPGLLNDSRITVDGSTVGDMHTKWLKDKLENWIKQMKEAND